MKKLTLTILSVLILSGLSSYAQEPQTDKGMFIEYEPNYFLNSILMDNREVEKKFERKEVDKRFFYGSVRYGFTN